jgi:hypothetical protein
MNLVSFQEEGGAGIAISVLLSNFSFGSLDSTVHRTLILADSVALALLREKNRSTRPRFWSQVSPKM